MALASIFRAACSERVLPVLADWWCRLRHVGVVVAAIDMVRWELAL
jgi:hypothetical protein